MAMVASLTSSSVALSSKALAVGVPRVAFVLALFFAVGESLLLVLLLPLLALLALLPPLLLLLLAIFFFGGGAFALAFFCCLP